MKLRSLVYLVPLISISTSLHAWDYAGHRIVNELALASLPDDFPSFVKEKANAERIAFLAGEPDRWRNNPDLPIKHYNGMDHYLDLEQLAEAGIDAKKAPDLRYVFAVEFAQGRAAHPEKFEPIDAAKNTDHSREWPGFLPWSVTEYYGKLKSAFSYLKTFQKAGTPEEVANAQANVIDLMGLLGHYVGDGAQPLHTTIHHNGWVGDNPHHYTTWSGIHSWIDGGFIAKAGITSDQLAPRVTPAQTIALTATMDGRDPVFVAAMDYLLAQNAMVEPFYALEKTGELRSANVAKSVKGRAFIEGQLLKGGEMLGSIWLTAWRHAEPDTYLERQLAKRQDG